MFTMQVQIDASALERRWQHELETTAAELERYTHMTADAAVTRVEEDHPWTDRTYNLKASIDVIAANPGDMSSDEADAAFASDPDDREPPVKWQPDDRCVMMVLRAEYASYVEKWAKSKRKSFVNQMTRWARDLLQQYAQLAANELVARLNGA